MGITLDVKALQTISLFEKKTRARIKDFYTDENKLVFVVQEGDLFKALGKQNANLKSLESLFKSKIKIVEYNKDVKRFVKNMIYPIKPEKIEESDGIITIHGKDTKSKGLLIGRSASNLNKLKEQVKKFFPIKDIKIV